MHKKNTMWPLWPEDVFPRVILTAFYGLSLGRSGEEALPSATDSTTLPIGKGPDLGAFNTTS